MSREGGNIGLLNTGPQSFIITLFYSFLLNFDWLVHLVRCKNVSTTNYKRGNFMYHYWRCTSTYQPLSYPLDPCVVSQSLLRSRGYLQCILYWSELYNELFVMFKLIVLTNSMKLKLKRPSSCNRLFLPYSKIH